MRYRFTKTQVEATRSYFLKHPRRFSVLIFVGLLCLALVAWDSMQIVSYADLCVYEGTYVALEYVPNGRRNSEHWRLKLSEMEFRINPAIGFDADAFIHTVNEGDILTVRQDDKSSPWIEEIKRGEETIHSYEQSLTAYKANSWAWKSIVGAGALLFIGAWFKLQYDVWKLRKKHGQSRK